MPEVGDHHRVPILDAPAGKRDVEGISIVVVVAPELAHRDEPRAGLALPRSLFVDRVPGADRVAEVRPPDELGAVVEPVDAGAVEVVEPVE
ncbi:MAG: hypothetical protein QM820_04995 [Minicystis sp.]